MNRILALWLIPFALAAQAGDSAAPAVNYEDDVRPIFRAHCFKCHNDDEQKGGLDLSSYSDVLKGGGGGEIVKAGRPGSSVLFQAVAHEGDDVAIMPPKQPKIAEAEIETIKKWIQQGLLEKAGGPSKVAPRRSLEFKSEATAAANGQGPMPNAPLAKPPAQKRANPTTALAASPCAPLAAVAGFEHIKLIDTQKRELLGVLPFIEGVPHALRFSRDGSMLLAAGGRGVKLGKVVLFDVRTGKRMGEFGDEVDEILAADISPDLKLIAYGGPSKVVKVVATKDSSLVYKISKHTDWITAVEFSPDGTRLATADRNGACHIWEAQSGGIMLSLSEHKECINSLSWRADSQMLATGGEDGQLIFWDAKDGWPSVTTSPHVPKPKGTVYGKLPSGVLSVQFSPDGKLFTVGRDKSLRTWNSEGKRVGGVENLPALPTRVAPTFDGKSAIIGDLIGELLLSTDNKSEALLASAAPAKPATPATPATPPAPQPKPK